MPIGLYPHSTRNFSVALVLACLLVAVFPCHARVGLSRSLLGPTGNKYSSEPARGISRFGEQALLKVSNEMRKSRVVVSDDYEWVTLAERVESTDLLIPVCLSYAEYRTARYAYDIREQKKDELIKSYGATRTAAGGQGVAIDVPFRIKSKTFRRLFGGDNVGVRVSGNIQINGSLRQQKSDQQQANQAGQNTSFRIHMTQQFSITGKIGQKVEVKVDQDSERLFDFQNSLKLTYTGDEDEILQKVEAGNVALNLGTRLATFSGRNTGLFGLKSEAKVGALSLTGIASLERGQKNRRSPNQSGDTRATINEKDFVKNQYFFLTASNLFEAPREVLSFRDQYAVYSGRTHTVFQAEYQLREAEIYREPLANEQVQGATQIYGRAASLEYYDSLALPTEEWNNFKSANGSDAIEGAWVRMIRGQDYEIDLQFGYIRLKSPLQSGQALACAFKLNGSAVPDSGGAVFGDLRPDVNQGRFVLLSPELPDPRSKTWPLMWRHVYSLGSASIDRNNFKLTISRAASSAGQTETGTDDGKSYLTNFQFDREGQGGSPQPDGLIDEYPVLVDWNRGELHFLALQPFDTMAFVQDPPGVETGWSVLDFQNINGDTSGYLADYLYNQQISTYDNEKSALWNMQAEYKGSTSVFELGPLVLENSEEVTLNGQPLQRGSDYTIDYLSGQLKILSEAAKASGADLEITYESGQFFQLEKKTLVGLRGEYELWPQSYIGGMVLQLTEKTLDKRVRIGSEPMRNTLYDVNTSLKFKPNFLSKAADMLPLVKTDVGSDFTIDGEIAKVFPNPNSLENSSTGDFNGLAYLDDFEGARRSNPLGLLRKQWTVASIPTDSIVDKNRGRFRWWNPNTGDQVPVRDVYPGRETNSQVAQTLQSLKMRFEPDDTDSTLDPRRSWGGVMRYLGEGFADQTRSQFLEFWIKLPTGAEARRGRLVVDLGLLSEDAIENDTLDSEDKPLPNSPSIPTQEYGNGVLSPDEDTGIDHQFAADNPGPGIAVDSAFWDGLDRPRKASFDDWAHEAGGSNFDQVNGTENSRNDEAGNFPDTEDLNDNRSLDFSNSYFSYSIPLSEDNPDIAGGNPDNSWRLFRIPINRPTSVVGSPDLSNIRWARVFLTGSSTTIEVEVVQMDIVSNEWLAAVSATDSTQYVSTAVINTHENPSYQSPPGVAGEIDPITQLRQREQSLVLKINKLDTDSATLAPSEFFVAKNLFQATNLLEYRRLKMFAHGGGEVTSTFPAGDVDLVLRLGQLFNSINRDYYEVVTPVAADWNAGNAIDIAMNELSLLTARRSAALVADTNQVAGGATGRYAYHDSTMQEGDSLVINGNPTLSRVGFVALGVRYRPDRKNASIEEQEIWVDELRVSDVLQDPGAAAELSSSLKIADLIQLQGSYSQRDADFHNVNTRIGTQESSQSWRGNASMGLQKFGLDKWGYNLPVTLGYTEVLSTPRYIPGTDSRLEPDQVPDSVKGHQNSTNMTFRFSKSATAKNPFIKYTVEKFSAGYDFSKDDRSDFNTQESKTKTEGANAAYNFPTSKGRGIAPLFWLKNVPLLAKLGNPRVYLKPTRLQVTGRADKRNQFQLSRPRGRNNSGQVVQQVTRSDQFNTTRGIGTGLAPFGPLTMDYNRTIRGQFEYEEQLTARDTIETDSGQFIQYDTTRVLRSDWGDLLKGNFGRPADITQTMTTNYSPQIFSWLRPTLSYSGQYQWNNRNFATELNQSVGNSRNIGADLVLDFKSIFGGGGGGGGRDGGRSRERNAGAGDRPRGTGSAEKDGPGGAGPDRDRRTSPGSPEDALRMIEEQLDPERMAAGIAERGAGRDAPGGRAESDTTEAPVVLDSLGRGGDSTRVVKPIATREPRPSLTERLGLVLWPIKKVLFVIDPVNLSYDNTAQHALSGTKGAEADWKYQLGFTQNPGLLKADSLNFDSRQQRNTTESVTGRSGVRLTRDIKATFNHALRATETFGTTIQGSTDQTKLWFASGGTPVPFADISVDWSGLEKFFLFKKFAESVSLTSGITTKVKEDWQSVKDSLTRRELTRQWNPLAGINVSIKGGIETQLRMNATQRLAEDLRANGVQTRENSMQVTGTVSYTVRTGFKIPFLWLSTLKLQNQTTLSMNLDYQTSKSESNRSADGAFSPTANTSAWSVQPRMTYSFSNTVQGQTYFQLQQNTNRITEQNSRTFEFGIQVNIAIRG